MATLCSNPQGLDLALLVVFAVGCHPTTNTPRPDLPPVFFYDREKPVGAGLRGLASWATLFLLSSFWLDFLRSLSSFSAHLLSDQEVV